MGASQSDDGLTNHGYRVLSKIYDSYYILSNFEGLKVYEDYVNTLSRPW